jgi:ABC-type uncharacterized transport system auxiliary subunit
MRRLILTALVVLLALLAASCGASRPIKYYALSTPYAPAIAANPSPISLLVGRISAPHLYRDDRIVYASGPTQRGTFEYDRWAEPPTEMIEAMLIEALRTSGQYRSVERLSSSARGEYIVRGRLDAIEEVDHPQLAARFIIELELYQPKTGTTVWTESYSHDEPVSEKKVPTVIDALQRNVQQGLSQLVAGMGQYFASHPPQ